MYCTACGKELHDEAVVCMDCGVGTSNKLTGTNENSGNLGGWTVLGFFVPIAALILYLIWKDEKPRTAKAVANGGVANLIVMGVFLTIYFLFFVFLFSVGLAVSV